MSGIISINIFIILYDYEQLISLCLFIMVSFVTNHCHILSDPGSPYCGVGWFYDPSTFNCFKLRYDGSWTWEEAHAACLSEGDGSDLASVVSLAEQTYINGGLLSNTNLISKLHEVVTNIIYIKL